VKQLIYVDAFVPEAGQSLFDFLAESEQRRMREAAKSGDGWRVPPNPTPPDTSAEDAAWLNERRVHTPINCFEAKLSLSAPLTLPRSYVYATRAAPSDTFGQFARKTRNDPAWRYCEIDASHSPNVTAPKALLALLEKIAAG